MTDVRVFLTGLMGSGKTTVGTQLAILLACDYVDNDAMLLHSHGASAQQLAVGSGAAILHAGEAANLRALTERSGPFVASVAASAGDRPDDLALLKAAGTLIYLRARPVTLAQRVGSGEGRPWLGGDPTPILLRMFQQRDDAFRAAATTVVDSDGVDPKALAERIARGLSANLG